MTQNFLLNTFQLSELSHGPTPCLPFPVGVYQFQVFLAPWPGSGDHTPVLLRNNDHPLRLTLTQTPACKTNGKNAASILTLSRELYESAFWDCCETRIREHQNMIFKTLPTWPNPFKMMDSATKLLFAFKLLVSFTFEGLKDFRSGVVKGESS